MATLDTDFTVAETAVVALQVAFPTSSSPVAVTWSLTGDATDNGSFTATSSGLENYDSATTLGNSVIVGLLSPGSYNLEATGDITGIRAAVGASIIGGVPQQLGGGAHSEPRVLLDGEDVIMAHVSVNAKKIYCTVNGNYVGELFGDVDAADIDAPDMYHRACIFARTATGLLCIQTSHVKPLFYRWVAWQGSLAATAAALVAASSVKYSGAYDSFTYCQADVSSDGDEVFCLVRYGTGSGNRPACLLRFTGFGSSITIAEDFIESGVTCYPRQVKVHVDGNGNDVVAIAYQNRPSLFPWGDLSCAFLQTNTNQLYNIAGVTMGSTSNGTEGSPRINVSTGGNQFDGGGPILIRTAAGNDRYQSLDTRLTSWSTGGRTAEAAIIFIDTTGTSDGYKSGGVAYRLGVVRGSSRVVSSSGGPSMFDGLDASLTYRLGSHIYYDGTTAHFLTIQGATSGIDADNDYYHWGDEGDANDETTVKHFTLDLSGALPTIDSAVADAGDITVACPEGERLIDIGSVYGQDDAVVFHVGVGSAHYTDPQGSLVLYNFTYPAVAVASSRRSGMGLRGLGLGL